MKTKIVKIGRIKIGGGQPIAVQSMLNSKPTDFPASARQLRKLLAAGCEIVRIAVPNFDSLATFRKLRAKFPAVPLVADIHFDWRLAVAAAEFADKIRINPGNLGSSENLKKVVAACRKKKIPIRVGVNAGSLEKNISGKNLAEKLANSALRNIQKIEKSGFKNIVVSAKSSDVKISVEANRILAKKISHPLHLGITEAGSAKFGTLKSAAGIGALLLDGIGDTLRISLTDSPEKEVAAAWDLLRVLGIRKRGIEIVSCPTCGRCEVDLIPLAKKVEKAVAGIPRNLKIAVMGCAVNGPGEAAHADFALVGGRRQFAIYRKGKFLKSISEKNALAEFLKTIAE